MKLFLYATAAALLFGGQAFAQTADQVGREILAAYQHKDAAALKKNMSPMLAAAVGKKFFEGKSVAREVEALKSWDGKVREVRYYSNKFGRMAAVHYADAPDGRFKVFQLIKGPAGWKHGMEGFSTVDQAKFMSYAAGEDGKAAAAAAADESAPNKGYALEMADGYKADAPSAEKVKELLGRLTEDNFFLTVTGPAGFMQAAYSGKGVELQYKDAAGQYSCGAVIRAAEAAEMLKSYVTGGKAWRTLCKWKPLE